MKHYIYIFVLAVVIIFTFCYCFREWADTKVFVARMCFKRYNGKAMLVEKRYYENSGIYGCWWKPEDRSKLDERWNTCENFNIGDINYEYPEASYDCL
jgi:hypothetical protein